jgi:hypothetical protein
MKLRTLLLFARLSVALFAADRLPPSPYPHGSNPPVNVGNGVWRFDRPRRTKPAFSEELAAMFNLIKPPDPTPFGYSIAFLAGVSVYKNMNALDYSGSDVTRMRNFLLESGGFDTVFEVRDEWVTSQLGRLLDSLDSRRVVRLTIHRLRSGRR